MKERRGDGRIVERARERRRRARTESSAAYEREITTGTNYYIIRTRIIIIVGALINANTARQTKPKKKRVKKESKKKREWKKIEKKKRVKKK